jgi:F-type H+-transporting ATPase subunit delta
MSELTTLARPYAKAAFEYALTKDNLAAWSEMLSFVAAVTSDATMQKLLDSPTLTKEQATAAMASVTEGQVDESVANFVKQLAANGRLNLAGEICELFEDLRAEYEKTIDVEMTSAVELSDELKATYATKLEQKLGRKVNINCQTDPAVMGGLVIRAGDMVIDASVRGKLNELADSLSI